MLSTIFRTSRKELSLPYLPAFSAILFLITAAIGCGPVVEPSMLQGGLYSVADGNGTYRAAKILLFDSNVVHLRLYCNTFLSRPDTILAGTLRIRPLPGEPLAREDFPIVRYLFRAWEPELVGFDSVTENEIRLVEEWRESGKNVVGGEKRSMN